MDGSIINFEVTSYYEQKSKKAILAEFDSDGNLVQHMQA